MSATVRALSALGIAMFFIVQGEWKRIHAQEDIPPQNRAETAASDEAQEEDRAWLEGTWFAVSCQRDGKPLDQPVLMRWVSLDGELCTIAEGEKTTQGRYIIEETGEPKQIVVTVLGKDEEAVLRISVVRKEGKLMICLEPATGTAAPGAFKSQEEDHRLLSTLEPALVRCFQGHTGPVLTAVFTPDGNRLVSGSGWPWGDRTIRVWDASSGEEIRSISVAMKDPKKHGPREVPGEVQRLAVLPDGRRVLAGGAGGFLHLYDLDRGKLLRRFEGHEASVYALALSPDGRRAVSGGRENLIRVWDLKTGKSLRQLSGHRSWIRTLAFSPDGTKVLSGSLDRTMRLWDVETGKEIRCFEHDAWVWSVAFSPDGHHALAASGPEIHLWDLSRGVQVRTLRGHGFGVTSAVYSPDGSRILSSGYDNTVRLWDAQTGRELCRYLGHRNWVWTVAFSPDGRYGLSAGGGYGGANKVAPGDDFALRLWNLGQRVGLEIEQ